MTSSTSTVALAQPSADAERNMADQRAKVRNFVIQLAVVWIGIFIILGVAVLQGYTLWAIAILAAYAIGFSLPLAAIMLGVSLGSSAVKAKKAEVAIRITAGSLLVIAGFYFLSTL